MLFLKEINIEDAKKEYIAIISIPEDENGFVNKFYNVSFEDFVFFGATNETLFAIFKIVLNDFFLHYHTNF